MEYLRIHDHGPAQEASCKLELRYILRWHRVSSISVADEDQAK
jgi:hypothetical protein